MTHRGLKGKKELAAIADHTKNRFLRILGKLALPKSSFETGGERELPEAKIDGESPPRQLFYSLVLPLSCSSTFVWRFSKIT